MKKKSNVTKSLVVLLLTLSILFTGLPLIASAEGAGAVASSDPIAAAQGEDLVAGTNGTGTGTDGTGTDGTGTDGTGTDGTGTDGTGTDGTGTDGTGTDGTGTDGTGTDGTGTDDTVTDGTDDDGLLGAAEEEDDGEEEALEPLDEVVRIPTETQLQGMKPQLEMVYDAIETGTLRTLKVIGTSSLGELTSIQNVKIEITSHDPQLELVGKGDFDDYTSVAYDKDGNALAAGAAGGVKLVLTRKNITAPTGNIITFGLFDVRFLNRTTADEWGKGVAADSTEGLVELTRLYWEGEKAPEEEGGEPETITVEDSTLGAGLDNAGKLAEGVQLMTRLEAIARNQWTYNALAKISDEEILRGNLDFSEAARINYVESAGRSAGLGVKVQSEPAQAYVLADYAEFMYEVKYSGALSIPDSYTDADIEKLIALELTEAQEAIWDVEYTLDKENDRILLHFKSKVPLNDPAAAVTSFSATLNFVGYYFTDGITQYSASKTEGYVRVTQMKVDGEGDTVAYTTAPKAVQTDLNTTTTTYTQYKVYLGSQKTPEEQFTDDFNSIIKQHMNWYYKTEGTGASELQWGVETSGTGVGSTKYISDNPITLREWDDDANEGAGGWKVSYVRLDKTWFAFSAPAGLAFPKNVQEFVIEDNTFGNNRAGGSSLDIWGFSVPKVGAGTKVAIEVDYGTGFVAYDPATATNKNAQTGSGRTGEYERIWLTQKAIGVRFVFTKTDGKAESDPISITQYPEILCGLQDGGNYVDKDTLTNTAKVAATYFAEPELDEEGEPKEGENGEIIYKDPVTIEVTDANGNPPHATVEYRANQPLPGGVKSGTNVDRGKRGANANAVVNMPGDQIDYTVKVTLPSSGTGVVDAVDVLKVLDVPMQNITIDKTKLNTKIYIKRGSAQSAVLPVDKDGNLMSGTPVTSGPYNGYELFEVPSPNFHTYNGAEGMMYEFLGTFTSSDEIVITYTAFISEELEKDGDGKLLDTAENWLYIKTWKTTDPGPVDPNPDPDPGPNPDPGPDPGPGPDPKPEDWGNAIKYPIKVDTVSIYGDVYIKIVDRAGASLEGGYLLPGDEATLEVKGGVANSPQPLEAPVFVVKLADNLVIDADATNIVSDVKLKKMTIGADSRTITENSNLSVTPDYFDAEGDPCDAADARFVRLAFPQQTLESAAGTGATYGANDIITFNIAVKTVAEAEAKNTFKDATSTAVLGYGDLAAEDLVIEDSLYLNVAGRNTSNAEWNKSGGHTVKYSGVYSDNGVSKAAKLFAEANSGNLTFLQDTTAAKVYHLPKSLKIVKQNLTGGTLLLGNTADFRITLTNEELKGITYSKYPDVNFDIDARYIVDVMVPGMKVENPEEIKVFGASGAQLSYDDGDYTVTVADVQENYNGKTVTTQRITIVLNRDYTLAPKETVKVEFTGKVLSTPLLSKDVESVNAYNRTSTYVNSKEVSILGKASAPYSKGQADSLWGNPTEKNGTEDTRLTAEAPVSLRAMRIRPGITKTRTSPNAGQNDVQAIGETVTATWEIVVMNGKSAERVIDRFTVADALPAYTDVLGAELKYKGNVLDNIPMQSYRNKSGQKVLYWLFDENNLPGGLAPNESITITLKTSTDGSVVGPVSNNAYIIPTGEDCFFDNRHIQAGNYDSASTTSSKLRQQLAAGEGQNGIALTRGVWAEAGMNLINAVGGYSKKMVTDDLAPAGPKSTSSLTPYTQVQTERGNTVTYAYDLVNANKLGTKNPQEIFTNISIIDNLPMINDSYVVIGGKPAAPRNSKWGPEFADENWSEISTETFKVYTKKNTDQDSAFALQADVIQSITPAYNNKNELTGFTIKLDKDFTLGGGMTMRVKWDMVVPEVASQFVNQVAYNSAAFELSVRGFSNLKAEPEKVGLYLKGKPDLKLDVEKYLQSAPSGFTEGTFYFRLTKQDPENPNDYLPVSLKDSGIILSDTLTSCEDMGSDYVGVFSIDAALGQVVRGTLSHMEEGKYRVEEDFIPTGFAAPRYPYGKEAQLQPGLEDNVPLIRVTNRITTTPTPPGPPPTDPPVIVIPPDPPPPPPVVVDPGDPEAPPVAIIPGTVSPAGELLTEDVNPTAGLGAHWSLLNLMCALFCGITSIIMLIMMLFRKLRTRSGEEEEAVVLENAENTEIGDTEEEQAVRQKGGYIWRVLSIIVALGGIIAFLLTEDIRNPMVFTCEWSPLMVTFAVSQVLVMLGLRNTLRKPDDEEALDDDDMTASEA